MNVFQALHSMRATSEFLDKPVDEKMIGLILHSATRALSAGNLQEWEFVVVEDTKTKEELSKAALGLRQIMKSPSTIVVCVDLEKVARKYGKRGELVYAAEDGAFATQVIAIAATAIGLGFDLIRAFDEEEVKGILNLPDNIRPVSIMPIGYPAHELEQESRNSFENITHVDRYGNKIEVTFEPVLNALERILAEMREKYKTGPARTKFSIADFKKFVRKLAK